MHHPQVFNYFVLCFALIAMFTLVACASETAPASLADQAGGGLEGDDDPASTEAPVTDDGDAAPDGTAPAPADPTPTPSLIDAAAPSSATGDEAVPAVSPDGEAQPASPTADPDAATAPRGGSSTDRAVTFDAGRPDPTGSPADPECAAAITDFDIDLAALGVVPAEESTSEPAELEAVVPQAEAITVLAGDELVLAFRCADRTPSYEALEFWGYTPEEARCTIDEVFSSEFITAEVIAVVHQLGVNPRELVPEAYAEAEATCLTETRKVALELEVQP